MKSLARILAASLLVLAVPFAARAQASASRTIVVKMVDKPGAKSVFEPAAIQARPGDVIRFIQTGTNPHNVDFKGTPAGVELGDLQTSAFLSAPGETLDITIDKRFSAGTYRFDCMPHSAIGMHGVLKITK